MRILSGKYKNRKLKSLANKKVRPTSSSVKKSLFEILKSLDGKDVLDLFSGIGSLGIESFSRGAKSVTFVEKNREIAKILCGNIITICPDEKYFIIKKDVNIFLKHHPMKYDIIFADPPYDLISFKDLQHKIYNLLNYGGIFCMEKRCDNEMYDKDIRIKKYGKTQILIWQKNKK